MILSFGCSSPRNLKHQVIDIGRDKLAINKFLERGTIPTFDLK